MLRPTLSTSLAHHSFRRSGHLLSFQQSRMAATGAATQKRAGDISDAFVSLSGGGAVPLEQRFAELKKRLIAGHEDAIAAAWPRLLTHLREELETLKELGSRAVPEIQYSDIACGKSNPSFAETYRQRGVCVVRGVLDEKEALGLKAAIRDYIAKNPHTKAFPANNPQVWELYWSPSQMRARSHPNLLETQRYLMSFWHASDDALISTSHPISYADRLRLRQPGDSQFALGPHVDGGSVERWEEGGYGLGGNGNGVYSEIWKGNWENYDPWDADVRLGAVSDLYQGVGACSMFRMAQGWMSMSNVGGGEGHLMVNPMLKGATAYFLMRPFFEAKKTIDQVGTEEYLKPANWKMESETTTFLQGATPGHGQELNELLHPHLDLQSSMVHIPNVRPGDFVAWHCDTIHSVDKTHAGQTDSSVLYIPVCPLTEDNARFLCRQRETFLQGIPSPDFGGGEGESRHLGRPTVQDLATMMNSDGLRAMGLMEWDSTSLGLSRGQQEVMDRANKELGFYM